VILPKESLRENTCPDFAGIRKPVLPASVEMFNIFILLNKGNELQLELLLIQEKLKDLSKIYS